MSFNAGKKTIQQSILIKDKNVSLAFGTTLNVYITKVDNAEHMSIFTDYEPHVFFDRAGDHHQMKMWIGGKVALRFL